MDAECLTRKRIWEVDCLSLDAAIAASFDWRELINMLEAGGRPFDLKKLESLLELQAQCSIHEYCHSENSVSLRIETLMNEWHKKTLESFNSWTPSQVAEYVLLSEDKSPGTGAVFWALGSDARGGFDCIRRRFHQRFQIFAIRRFAAS